MHNENVIKKIRAFNRFYINIIGVLDKHILSSPYSVTEIRVLYEIYHTRNCTARSVKEKIRVDEGYLSHIVDKFVKAKFILKRKSLKDGRVYTLKLSKSGEKKLLELDQLSTVSIGKMIENLSREEAKELVMLMERTQELISKQ